MSNLLLLALLPSLGQTPWSLVADSGDVQVYSRPHQGARVYEHRAEAVIKVAPARFWEVLSDTNRQADFIPYLVESKILMEKGNNRTVYQRLSAPVINDRDYTVELQVLPDPDTGIYEQRFTIARNKGPAPKDGVVRVELATGRWLLEPTGDGGTRVTYELVTDPGGWIPAWMVNVAQKRALPDIIGAMAKRAQDPQFRK